MPDTILHNRKPNRLCGCNYSQDGYYFVSIRTRDRREWFGKIENGAMKLNKWGEIAKKIWIEIPKHFENAKLDKFVIMPNHIHGIIIIENDDIGIVGNRHACSLRACSLHTKRQYQSIPIIVGSYKSAVTKYINMTNNKIGFHWQKSFYDSIIRSKSSLNRIRRYIDNNPQQWPSDKENPNLRLTT